MLDDDIQYIGTRVGSQSSPSAKRAVVGIALHVEKSDGNDAYVMKFQKDKSNNIDIGRRPSSEIEPNSADEEKGKATFRCAVVSRRHARIALSDTGYAYLIDLGSHHGTHIRKPGETSSRALEPEYPTQLFDGDIITFGKTVGRSEELVRPVVARVQLLYSGPSVSPIKPLIVPDNLPSMSKSHSGRYGLRSPSTSSSSDEYFEQADSFSDIEEIPAPPPVGCTDSQAKSQPQSQAKPESHIGRALEVLKRLLPPASSPSTPQLEQSSPRFDEPPVLQSHSSSSSSSLSSLPYLPPLWSSVPRNFACSSLAFLPLQMRPADHSFDDYISLPPIHPPKESKDQQDDNGSVSESSMDIASPSPAPQREFHPDPEPQAEPEPQSEAEPLIIGAWPDIKAPACDNDVGLDPPPPFDPLLLGLTPSFNSLFPQEEGDHAKATSHNASENQAAEDESVEEHEEHEEERKSDVADEVEEGDKRAGDADALVIEKKVVSLEPQGSVVADAGLYVTKVEYEDLKQKHTRLQVEIEILHAKRRSYKSKFNANVHTLTEKFREIEERLNEINAQCTSFSDRVEEVIEMDWATRDRIDDLGDEQRELRMDVEELQKKFDVPMQRHVESLQEEQEAMRKNIEELQERIITEMARSSAMDLREKEKGEVQMHIRTLRDLVEEMKSLRAATEKEVKSELDALKQLRQSIINEATSNATLRSLKRRRCDDDHEEDEQGSGMFSDEKETTVKTIPAKPIEGEGDITTVIDQLHPIVAPSTPPNACCQGCASPIADRPSPRKRARTVASIAAQTATAVTVGAVAAWSALAFS